MPAPKPIREASHRVRVFVDFWNYTLLVRGVDPGFQTDWSRLGPVLARAAATVVDEAARGEYQGLNFYGSWNPSRPRDRNLHRWATTVVDTFPGVSVSIVPRQRELSPPKCPHCCEPVARCPVCDADMRRTREKSVDVRMATDMIRLAWAANYDIAVLVSSDRDFVPVAEFLETRGIKVIHAAFPPKGRSSRRDAGAVSVFQRSAGPSGGSSHPWGPSEHCESGGC